MPKGRPKDIPGSWIRAIEAAHRFGVHTNTIVKWSRLGYFPRYRWSERPGSITWFDWNEIVAHPYMKKELARFHARLEAEEAADELPAVPRAKDPVPVEPLF